MLFTSGSFQLQASTLSHVFMSGTDGGYELMSRGDVTGSSFGMTRVSVLSTKNTLPRRFQLSCVSSRYVGVSRRKVAPAMTVLSTTHAARTPMSIFAFLEREGEGGRETSPSVIGRSHRTTKRVIRNTHCRAIIPLLVKGIPANSCAQKKRKLLR